MSAVDLAASHPSSEFEESDLYEPPASTLGSRYKRVVRSKSSIAAADRLPNSDLKVVKLEVKPQPAGRSGLLAAQLKGYAGFACNVMLQRCCLKSLSLPLTSCRFASHSDLPVSASSDGAHSRKRADKADIKPSLPTVDEVSSASVESTTSAVQLPLPVSPCSGNTSPLAVPTKRQNRSGWRLAAADNEFVPPHLLTTQTLPSDFVFAEDSRPVSTVMHMPRRALSRPDPN